MNTLTVALTELAKCRAAIASARIPLDAKRKAFDEENGDLISHIACLATTVAAAEIVAREAVLADYLVSKNKQPCPGAGIRITVEYVYENDRALVYARERMQDLIKESLDKSTFEAVLKSKLDSKAFDTESEVKVPGFDFVTARQNASATLSTDLSFLLESNERDS